MSLAPTLNGDFALVSPFPTSPSFVSVSLTGAVDLTAIPSKTAALNRSLLQIVLAHETAQEFVWGVDGSAINVGSGSSNGGPYQKILSTGVAPSSSAGYFSNPSIWAVHPLTLSILGFNWSDVVTISQRFTTNSSVPGLTTNAVFRTLVGASSGTGPLVNRGVGFGVIRASATTGTVVIYAHNGTSLTTFTTSATIDLSSSAVVHEVLLNSDGLGNLYCIVDGTYAGTTTGGPVTDGGGQYIVCELQNGIDTTDNQMAMSSVRVLTHT